MQNPNQSLNQTLQARYPHLELAILPLSQVQKDNESKRIDSEYFKKECLENEAMLLRLNSTQLKDTDISIKHPAEIQRNYVDSENGVWFFRTQNLRPLFIDSESNRVFISKQDAKKLEKNLIQKDDILITRTGANCGDCAVYNIDMETIASSHILIAKNSFFNQCFLAVFLNTQYGKKQINRGIYGGLQPEIAPYYLKNIYVPQFSQDFQREIQNLVQDSHKALEDSKALYKDAERLLYEALGLDSNNPLAALQNDPHPLAPSAREGEQESESKSPLPCGGDLGVGKNNKNIDCHENSLRSFSRNDNKGLDCHDLTTQNLAMTSATHSPSLVINTPPQTPPARGGAYNDSPSLAEGARGWGNPNNDDIAQKYPHLNLSIRSLSQSYGISGRLDSEYYQSKYDLMESKIKSKGFKTLQEICSLINYGSVPTSPYTENGKGVPYIKGLNLKNLEISEDKLDRITNVENLDSRFFTKENDIIISQMGTVGDCGVVSKAQENYIFASFTIRIRLKYKQEFNPYFVALYIQNIAKEWYLLRNIAQASVRQNTDLPTIRNLYIPLVDSTTQTQIAQKIQKSFALRKESKDLLQSAKAKVEKAIENFS